MKGQQKGGAASAAPPNTFIEQVLDDLEARARRVPRDQLDWRVATPDSFDRQYLEKIEREFLGHLRMVTNPDWHMLEHVERIRAMAEGYLKVHRQ